MIEIINSAYNYNIADDMEDYNKGLTKLVLFRSNYFHNNPYLYFKKQIVNLLHSYSIMHIHPVLFTNDLSRCEIYERYEYRYDENIIIKHNLTSYHFAFFTDNKKLQSKIKILYDDIIIL